MPLRPTSQLSPGLLFSLDSRAAASGKSLSSPTGNQKQESFAFLRQDVESLAFPDLGVFSAPYESRNGFPRGPNVIRTHGEQRVALDLEHDSGTNDCSPRLTETCVGGPLPCRL